MRFQASVLCALLALAAAAPVLAFSAHTSAAMTYPYVAAFEPTFRNAFPYTGTMQLTFQKGIISGTYRDMSIKPTGPFRNSGFVPVTGGVTTNNIVRLSIGPAFSIANGRIDRDGTISGTANSHGQFYNFLAKIGKPGSG